MSNKGTITDLSLKAKSSKQDFLNYVRKEDQRKTSHHHLWRLWWIQTSQEWRNLVLPSCFSLMQSIVCYVTAGFFLANVPDIRYVLCIQEFQGQPSHFFL